jgi:c-di-GMP-binding flagellar brake protein YcgR
MEQGAEILRGSQAMEILQFLVGSRRMCKIEIPNTNFCWLSILLHIQKKNNETFLIFDGLERVHSILARFPHREVRVEYLEIDGILCHFNSRVVHSESRDLWLSFPEEVYRFQRRRFYRLKALAGTEITFQMDSERQGKGKVRDYSLGGAAFLADQPLNLKKDDRVENIYLRIPCGGDWFIVHIPSAIVSRVEKDMELGSHLYAVQFFEMTDPMRNCLTRHIFEQQRSQLRKVGKRPLSSKSLS